MSFVPRPCRKITCGGRRHALMTWHLMLYSIVLIVCVAYYHWPQSEGFISKSNTRNAAGGHGCSGNRGDDCSVQRVSGRDVAALPPAKITEVTQVNATVKTSTQQTDLRRLEPKNWNGQGYQPVPTNKGPLRHCKQCALVTSSGHLSGKGAGREIDNSECVIRMNAAPTLKYEKDVGSKTTFRVVGHRNFPRMFDTEDERKLYFVNTTTKSEALVVLWLYSVNVNRNLELILARKFAQKYKNITFYLTKQEIMNRNVELFYQELGMSNSSKDRMWMSTGWVAMLFALEVCDAIDVYGMIYDDYCEEHPGDQTSYHYFDTVQKECSYYERSEKRLHSGHKFMTEKVAFARWAAMYDIKFHLPSWENHTYDPKGPQKETVFQKVYGQYKEKMSGKAKDDSKAKAAEPNLIQKSKTDADKDRTKDKKVVANADPKVVNSKDQNRTDIEKAKKPPQSEQNDSHGDRDVVVVETNVVKDDTDGNQRALDEDLIEEHVQKETRR